MTNHQTTKATNHTSTPPQILRVAVEEEHQEATIGIFQQETWYAVDAQQWRIPVQGTLLGNPYELTLEALSRVGRMRSWVQDPGQKTTLQHRLPQLQAPPGAGRFSLCIGPGQFGRPCSRHRKNKRPATCERCSK